MALLDYLLGLPTPKLMVPSEFKVCYEAEAETV